MLLGNLHDINGALLRIEDRLRPADTKVYMTPQQAYIHAPLTLMINRGPGINADIVQAFWSPEYECYMLRLPT